MKTSRLILFILLITNLVALAQNVGINSSGAAPDNSAMLDVTSTTKGFLMPRMTIAQMIAIPSPVVGLMVYNTDCNVLQYYNGTMWVRVLSMTNASSTTSNQTFIYTGATQNFVVPACVTSVTIKAWGAGGGGGGHDGGSGGSTGGGGGYSTTTVAVTPGDVLQVYVGLGGRAGSSAVTNSGGGTTAYGYCLGGSGGNAGGTGSSGGGGGGGGSTGVVNSTTTAVLCVASGGGGGGGAGNVGGQKNGGAGGAGGTAGSTGGSGAFGGAAGGNSTCAGGNATNRGVPDGGGPGGGGGGYQNGGAAGIFYSTTPDYGAGGGGGGIGYGTLTPGSGATPGNSADSDLCAGCATGGAAATVGTNGYVKIYYQ
jgi:hypothetical protein